MTTSKRSTALPPGWPPSRADIEWERCRRSAARFVDGHCQIEDRAGGSWLPFRLWPVQRDFLGVLAAERFVANLKARQLGLTWVVLAWALHLLLFRRGTCLLFSQRDDDAQELIRRLAGMHARLTPAARGVVAAESKHELTLSTGATAIAFPTTARSGRSYTASFVLIDEADHVSDLQSLLDAVKPTIDGGGQLVLLSTADKSHPESPFKTIYRAAKAGTNSYRPVFHGWDARPGRTPEWYALQCRDSLANTGSLDHVHQEYPATDEEALAPRSLDKRIPAEWVRACYRELSSRPSPDGAPPLPGLVVFRPPQPGRIYCVGADPAEGNPTSDESALAVLDALSGEEVARLSGRLQPSAFAAHIDAVGCWYGGACVLAERNNHGHAVLLWLEANSRLPVLLGHDDRPGWLSSAKGKALLYDACADAFRHGDTVLHDFGTLTQLQSIEGSTLRAPSGQHDDRADAYALAVVAAPAALALARQDAPDEVAYT
jgi:hypothetical protein